RSRVGDAHFRGRYDCALRVAHATEQRCRVTDLRQRHHNECEEQARKCESFIPYPKHGLFCSGSMRLSRQYCGELYKRQFREYEMNSPAMASMGAAVGLS